MVVVLGSWRMLRIIDLRRVSLLLCVGLRLCFSRWVRLTLGSVVLLARVVVRLLVRLGLVLSIIFVLNVVSLLGRWLVLRMLLFVFRILMLLSVSILMIRCVWWMGLVLCFGFVVDLIGLGILVCIRSGLRMLRVMFLLLLLMVVLIRLLLTILVGFRIVIRLLICSAC